MVPPLPARLVYVGADRQLNTRNGPLFVVRAALDPGAEDLLPADVALSPGMPADVLIRRAPRTALDYLLSPLLDAARRGMRDQ